VKLYRGPEIIRTVVTHRYGVILYVDEWVRDYRFWHIEPMLDSFPFYGSSLVLEPLWGTLNYRYLLTYDVGFNEAL
jgi:hypothetical protein